MTSRAKSIPLLGRVLGLDKVMVAIEELGDKVDDVARVLAEWEEESHTLEEALAILKDADAVIDSIEPEPTPQSPEEEPNP